MDALAWGIFGALKERRKPGREGTATDNIDM